LLDGVVSSYTFESFDYLDGDGSVILATVQKIKDLKLNKTLIFHPSISSVKDPRSIDATAKLLTTHFNGDIEYQSVSSRDSSKKRMVVLDKFLTGKEPMVISNVRLFDEGIDVPNIDGIIFLSDT
jgi:superfamily II DNA or RNA helicase